MYVKYSVAPVRDCGQHGGYGKTSRKVNTKKEADRKKENTEDIVNQETEAIAVDCEGIIEFLQDFTIKAPRVVDAPLLLLTNKFAREWSWCYLDCNIYPISPISPTPLTQSIIQYLQGSWVMLQRTLRTRRKPTHSLWCSTKTTKKQRDGVIFKAITLDGARIPTLQPPSIHQFFNTFNPTTLQSDCALTYTGHNL